MSPAPDARFAQLDQRDRCGVMRSEIGRVEGRLRAKVPADLERPAKGDWTIREVIAHLVVVPQFYAHSIERGRSGDVEVSGARPAAGTGRGEVAADGIKVRAREVADSIGGSAIDAFVESATTLVDLLDRPESDLQYRCYHPGGLVPANRFAVLFLKELGIHEWDMFAALDDTASIGRWGADAAIQAMEEELASGSLRWVTGAPGEGGEPSTVIRVAISGSMDAARDLVLSARSTTLETVDPQREPDATWAVAASDLVLCCSGRLDPVAAGSYDGPGSILGQLAGRLTGM